MARTTANQVLLSIADIPMAYGATVFDDLCKKLGPSRWWGIAPEWRIAVATIHIRAEALEAQGLIRSEWSEPLPDRGNRRRRYYFLTEAGEARVAQIRAEQAKKTPGVMEFVAA